VQRCDETLSGAGAVVGKAYNLSSIVDARDMCLSPNLGKLTDVAVVIDVAGGRVWGVMELLAFDVPIISPRSLMPVRMFCAPGTKSIVRMEPLVSTKPCTTRLSATE
jgi:hypothetical protein